MQGGAVANNSSGTTTRVAIVTIQVNETTGLDTEKYVRDIIKKIGIDVTVNEVQCSPSRRALGCNDASVEYTMKDDFAKAQAFIVALEDAPFVVHLLLMGIHDEFDGKPRMVLRKSLSGISREFDWFPVRVNQMDKFAGKVMSYGAELDADHPGFKDEAYRERRAYIVRVAQQHRHGQPIARIEYLPEEIATWRTVYSKLKGLFATHACEQFNRVLPVLERECGYSESNIPQLEDVSNFLQRTTGWSVRPVQGLLSSRDFLNGLAFRVMHCTQYIRHSSVPMYTPEPDVCHELLGHIPLFADPAFARFSQELGMASLGASDEDIKRIGTCYWFTVEFGLCRQGADLKVYGAGLLSSFGELEYCLTEKAGKKALEMQTVAKTEYPITAFQPFYFVAESFREATRQILEFTRELNKPFLLNYNAFTQSVEIIESKYQVQDLCEDMRLQSELISLAMRKICEL